MDDKVKHFGLNNMTMHLRLILYPWLKKLNNHNKNLPSKECDSILLDCKKGYGKK